MGDLGVDSLLSVGSILSEVSEPLSTLGIFVDSGIAWSDHGFSWLLVSSCLLSLWLGDDGGVDFLVKVFAGLGLGGSEALLPSGELSLEFSWVLLLKAVHVIGDMVSEDVSSKDLGIELGLSLLGADDLSSLALDLLNDGSLVTWESLGLVGHVHATVASTLEDSEDSGASGGWGESDIEEGLEWLAVTLDVLVHVEVVAVDVVVALVRVSETDLHEQSSSEQETSAVSSGVVGKSSSDTIVL